MSDQIRAIFANYTDLIEPLSLDKAYLDVSDDARGIGSATAIATEIRARIRDATGLTASAGVSSNKFTAKLASDQNKPDGLCVIRPEQGPVESPQSNGMAEAFVPTLKRDYARVNPRPDARTVIDQLPGWFAHYNTVQPLRALGYCSPREFIAR